MILERTLSLPLALPRLIKAKLAKAEAAESAAESKPRRSFFSSFEGLMSAGISPLVASSIREFDKNQ